jgi:hypothetical protein
VGGCRAGLSPSGIADLWAPDDRRDDALASLLRRCRAQVLRELDRPAATLDLARRIGVGRTWGSSDGPVEHVKTGCERGHWFTPTADSIRLRVDQVDQVELVPAAV